MAVNNEKLNKFHQAINHYAQEQRRKIEEEVAAFKQKELEEAELEVLTESYQMLQTEMTRMQDGISREMAQREMESRRALLRRRQEIMEDIFMRASDALRVYTSGPEYPALLERFAGNLSDVFPDSGAVLCMRAADSPFEALVARAFGKACSFETDDSISIGGIRAYQQDTGLEADETLDTLLADQREWFEENSGLAMILAGSKAESEGIK